MRCYSVKQKKKTKYVPGSEQYRTLKNGRLMMSSICSECGTRQSSFVGGAIQGGDFACGYDLKCKKAGTVDECFKKGQIRYWGINKLDDGYIDILLADRLSERARKATERRAANRKQRVKKPVTEKKPVPLTPVVEPAAEAPPAPVAPTVQTRVDPNIKTPEEYREWI